MILYVCHLLVGPATLHHAEWPEFIDQDRNSCTREIREGQKDGGQGGGGKDGRELHKGTDNSTVCIYSGTRDLPFLPLIDGNSA